MTSSRRKPPAGLPTAAAALAHAGAGRWRVANGWLHLDDVAQALLCAAQPRLPLQDWLLTRPLADAHRLQAALAEPADSLAVTLQGAGADICLIGRMQLPKPVRPVPHQSLHRVRGAPHLPCWQGLVLARPLQEGLEGRPPPSLSARDEFVASIGHELRTPLNAILGFNRLARLDCPPSAVQRHLDHIDNASRVMLRVVNDLLDLARLEAGRLDIEPDQALHVPALLTRVGALAHGLLHDRPVAVYTTMDPACPQHLRGDVLRVEQVLNNLVSNALKFTHQGSVTVGVKVRLLHNDQVTLRWSVADTGMGIAPDQMGHMGEAFHQGTTAPASGSAGTGLGLAVVRRLLELHDTHLRLASMPGGGTIAWFDLTLPLDRCAPLGALPAHTAVFSNNHRLIDTVATQWAARGQGLVPRDAHAQALHWVVDSSYPSAPQVLEAAQRGGHRAVCVSVLPPEPGSAVHALSNAASMALGPPGGPLAGAHAVAAGTTNGGGAAPPAALWGLRALVLEDNPLNQQVIKEVLRLAGVQVTLVGDSHQALQQLAASPPSEPAFDVALFDIQLPGESGLATARIMRNMAVGRTLPLIFLSAHLDLQERLEASELGALGCLLKPFDPEALLALLQRVPAVHTAPPGAAAARAGAGPAAAEPRGTTHDAPPACTPPVADTLQTLFTEQWPRFRQALAEPAATPDLLAAVHALRGSLAVMRQPQALALARQLEDGLRAGQQPAGWPLRPLLQQLVQLADSLAAGTTAG